MGDEDPLQGLWNAEGEQQLGQQLQQLFASVTTSLSGELCAASNATKEGANLCQLCYTIIAMSELSSEADFLLKLNVQRRFFPFHQDIFFVLTLNSCSLPYSFSL